jgi:hypothetical protein
VPASSVEYINIWGKRRGKGVTEGRMRRRGVDAGDEKSSSKVQ